MNKVQRAKGLPKRVSRDGYKARKARYKSESRREKNKARRIVKDARRGSDPRKVALAQAELSPGTWIFVKRIVG